ncbi:unnamed protein product [Bursaphelenchus xylophilus]|uniref:(pine wood nematode) hypothetical protein n=1 Tax=Bursaphelenchus xylophilus TaxID=6326 RepID=A0A1I7SSL8_BURXY|nr:unnamed protein product [Bursaphelenchus xylophilus]CAG9097420.1 unnamed protein product [Bursaphelenchus xylophilus]
MKDHFDKGGLPRVIKSSLEYNVEHVQLKYSKEFNATECPQNPDTEIFPKFVKVLDQLVSGLPDESGAECLVKELTDPANHACNHGEQSCLIILTSKDAFVSCIDTKTLILHPPKLRAVKISSPVAKLHPGFTYHHSKCVDEPDHKRKCILLTAKSGSIIRMRLGLKDLDHPKPRSLPLLYRPDDEYDWSWLLWLIPVPVLMFMIAFALYLFWTEKVVQSQRENLAIHLAHEADLSPNEHVLLEIAG